MRANKKTAPNDNCHSLPARWRMKSNTVGISKHGWRKWQIAELRLIHQFMRCCRQSGNEERSFGNSLNHLRKKHKEDITPAMVIGWSERTSTVLWMKLLIILQVLL